MRITDWFVDERPREKLLRLGHGSLSDAELLALILRTGIAGQNAIELARCLLKRFSDLPGLMRANIDELGTVKGLGQIKCIEIKAATELSLRYLRQSTPQPPRLGSHADIQKHLESCLDQHPNETCVALFLDEERRLLGTEYLRPDDSGAGWPASGVCAIRQRIVRFMLVYNATQLIFCHKIPLTITEPEDFDSHMQRGLDNALQLLDSRLLDYLLLCQNETLSLCY